MIQKKFGRDLTTGSIPRHLLAVALPMLAGNVLNTGYGIVNTIWLGKIVGDQAVAATAVSFPVVFIFIALAMGATMATTILVSQYYGARDFKAVRRTVGTSFSIALILGVILATAGIFMSNFFLQLLKTPDSIIGLALPYLKLSFVGFIFMYLSVLVTSILRGIGDTKTPLYFMAIGVGVNAILDPLLIAGPGPFPRWGLAGAAIASIISAAVAFVTGAFYLNSRNSMVAFTPRRLAFHGATAKLIFKIGLPSMVQQSLISLGMAAVTFLVTRFGEPALAAFGAAGRCDSIAFMPAMSMGMAVSTIAGQNLGAGRLDRVHESFKWGIYMTTAMSGFMAIVFLSVPSQLMSMFVNDPAVIRIGSMYLRIIGPSLMAFAVLFVSNGVINGAGRTMITMIFSLVSLWGFRVPLAWFLSRTSLGTTGIWIGMASSFVLMMFVSLAYYRSGKWQKNIVIPNKMEELTTPLVAAEV